MTKYILNGQNGVVGSAFCDIMKKNDIPFMIYDKDKKKRVEIFLHLAAKLYSDVDGYITSNIILLQEVIGYCYENGIKNLVFFSGARVYGDQDKQNFFKLMNVIIDTYNLDLSKYHNITLNKEDIEILKNEKLITIGAHTHNHLSLKSLEDEDIKEEVLNSRKILESYGLKIKHFAYPYGSKNEVDKRVVDIVRKLGFTTAVTTTKGSIDSSIDMFDIPRIIINGNFEHIDYFKLQIKV